MAFAIAPISAEADNLSWHELRIGQMAYLNDDGGQAFPLCRDYDKYLAFAKRGDDCGPRRPAGSVVKITKIYNGEVPVVGIQSTTAGWRGYCEVVNLTPIILVGTKIDKVTTGNAIPSMYMYRNFETEVQLGSPVVLQLLKQTPPDGNADFQVRVLTGKRAGTVGWALLINERIHNTEHTAKILGD